MFVLLRGEENCYKNVGEWEGNGLSVSRVVLWLLVIKTMATYQEKVEQQASRKRTTDVQPKSNFYIKFDNR